MNYQKLKNKLKCGTLAGAMILSGFCGVPTYASEEYPGHDYVRQVSGIPAIFIGTIDLTNDQLEFRIEKSANIDEATIAGFGAGWVTDRSIIGNDIRSFDSVSNSWSESVFWSGSTPISEYFASENDEYRAYIVDSTKKLSENPNRDLFYIFEFTDGTKWINWVDYSECGMYVSMGRSCQVLGYDPWVDVNSISYSVVSSPAKFVREGSENSDGADDADDSGDLDDSSVNNESEGGSYSEGDDNTEGAQTTEDASMGEKMNEDVTPGEDQVTEVAQTSKETTVTTENDEPSQLPKVQLASSANKISTETNSGDDEWLGGYGEEDDDFEVFEGSGDTTLDVPLLGKTTDGSCEFNWLPYFLGGAGLGIISTWFLFSLIHKKENRKHLL